MTHDLRDLVRAKARQENLASVEKIRSGVHAHVAANAGKPAYAVSTTWRRWTGYGAVVAAVLVVVALGHKEFGRLLPGNQANAITYTTRNAQTARVTLQDGSVVSLAPATSVTVTGREVTLKGEAAFQVTQNSVSPFIVRMNTSTVRVLGTEFAVQAYNSDIRVAVRTGRVDVDKKVLEAGDIIARRDNTIEIVRNTDVTQSFSFTTGRLSLDGIALGDAIDDLNRWFDADVRVTDAELRRRPFVGSLPPGSLAELAAALRLTLGAKVIQHGRIITITPNGVTE